MGMTFLTDTLTRLGDLSVPLVPPATASVRDQDLLDAQRELAEVRRRHESLAAAVAGEIAYRSRRELGHDGLAQSRGQRTAEGLISQLTGGSTREARTLVKAGELLPTAAPRVEAAAGGPVVGRHR